MRSLLTHLVSIQFLAMLAFAASAACATRTASAGSAPDFTRDIRPIFAEKCYACHGPDENKREADLRFDIMEEAIDFGVIKPGDPENSFLVERITADDPEEIMPPPRSKKTLGTEETKLLVDWIKAGAEYETHWSFQPISTPSVPRLVDDAGWIRDPMDSFILSRLREENIRPAPPADTQSLLRRVSLDLTGLPPTVDEMDAFHSDASPNAYERAVDRLLASPRYGEHMAALWLDVARYADTFGYQNDKETHVWPWRDWVIRAFNDNLPYDDFITHQIAGDLLPNATQDQRLATAFNRLHRQTNEGGSVEEEYRLEYVADRAETFGTAVLGLTFECARCHDHKFDPILQKDFYQLSAFFTSIDESGMYSHFTETAPTPAMLLFKPGEETALETHRTAIRKRESDLSRTRDEAGPRFDKWVSGADREPLIREPIISLDFDAPPEEGKLLNGADPEHPAQLSGPYHERNGFRGTAAAFDGDNSVSIKEVGNFDRYEPFTISMRLWAAAEKPRAVIVHRSQAALDAASRGYELLLEDGRPLFSLVHFWPGNAIRVRATEPIPLNRWVHLAATYDGSSKASGVSLYMDGERVAVEVVRDNLYKTIRYGSGSGPDLRLGGRFRDNGFEGGGIDDFRLHDVELSELEVQLLAGGQQESADRELLRDHYLSAVDEQALNSLKALKDARVEEAKFVESIRQIMVMEEMAEPRPAHLLARGDYRYKRDEVKPGTPVFLPAFDERYPRNRLGLARWLFDPAHPLTARVAVNRLWQQLFGRGLIPTPEDLGAQGEPPLYSELLDHLATRYRESEWDTKALLREIVLSATYRQSSRGDRELLERDPANALLARGPRYRLSAEQIRDAALTASGLLSDILGGPSVKPYQPEGIWKDSSSVTYKQDTGESLYRRSMYTFIKRTAPPPSMLTFDATNRETCVVGRERTETPLQALVLLNDPQFVEASRVLAELALAKHGRSIEPAIAEIFRALTSVRSTEAQAELLLEAHAEQKAWFDEHPEQATAYRAVGEHPADPDLMATEVAAMTAVAQMVMNFDAFQMKQ